MDHMQDRGGRLTDTAIQSYTTSMSNHCRLRYVERIKIELQWIIRACSAVPDFHIEFNMFTPS